MKTLSAALATLLLVDATGPSPQDTVKVAPSPTSSQDKKLVLEAGSHRVEDLIDAAAKFLGRNYICSPAEVAGAATKQIELQKRLELDAKGCEEVTSQLLYMLGFVVTRVDPAYDLYECLFLNGPRRNDITNRAVRMPPEEVMIRTGLKMMVTCSIPLRHINAQTVSNVLRPFFATSQSSGAMTLAAVEQRTLCVTGFTDEVAKCIRIVQDADQPPERPDPSLEERLTRIEARLAALEKKAEPVR